MVVGFSEGFQTLFAVQIIMDSSFWGLMFHFRGSWG